MTQTALILVDIQNDYFPSFPDSKMALSGMDDASGHAADILEAARNGGVKIQLVSPPQSSKLLECPKIQRLSSWG